MFRKMQDERDDIKTILLKELPGLEFNVDDDLASGVVTVRARRRTEFFEGSIDELRFVDDASGEAFLRRLIVTAQDKAIADYGLTPVLEKAKEAAAVAARKEVLHSLRAKLNTYREWIDALDADGEPVRVRGALNYELADLWAWAGGE